MGVLPGRDGDVEDDDAMVVMTLGMKMILVSHRHVSPHTITE